jgi:hypothetical protein
MQLGPKAGYRVLADRLRDELYVLVAPGTAAAAAEVPGVHVLGRGRQLLMPTTDHGTFCAHWISARQSSPLLVPADQLVTALRELTDPTCLPHETAVS